MKVCERVQHKKHHQNYVKAKDKIVATIDLLTLPLSNRIIHSKSHTRCPQKPIGINM